MKPIKLKFFSSLTIAFFITVINLPTVLLINNSVLQLQSMAFAQSQHKRFEITKTNCMQFSKNYDINQIKENLLISAKKSAVSELYGDLIYSNSILDQGILVDDEVHANGLGLIKINGDPLYFNGHNLGEICIKIKAFVTEEDKKAIIQKIKISQQNSQKSRTLMEKQYKSNIANTNDICVFGTASISAQCRKNPCPLSQKRINAEMAAIAQAEMKVLTSKHNTKITISNGETHLATELLKMGKIQGRTYPPVIDGDIVTVKYCLELVKDFYAPK